MADTNKLELSDADREILIMILQESVLRERVFPYPRNVIDRAKVILDRLKENKNAD
jgi:hypothetical protein